MSEATARPTTGSHRIVEALSALRHRNYRLYWLGQLSSVLAQNMEGIAQSWLVLDLTNSPLLLGLTGLAFAIPTITLTLLGGVIADRADRRRIMIFSQLGSASIFFVLATLVVIQWVALWHVMTLAFLSGCIRAFDRPSRMALLPQMVPKEDIPNAVAVGGTIWQLNRLVGPAVAGLLIYLVGIGPTYYFCFFASLSAVCLWLGIRFEHQPTAVSSGGLLQHMMDGLNFIRKNEIFYTFISMTFFNSVFGMSYLILMPVLTRGRAPATNAAAPSDRREGRTHFAPACDRKGAGGRRSAGCSPSPIFPTHAAKAGKPSAAPSYSVSCSFSLRSQSRIPSR